MCNRNFKKTVGEGFTKSAEQKPKTKKSIQP